MLAPKTTPVMLVSAAVMGLTFLSTVPPTAGLVARFFGPAHSATLFGLVMVSHQVGGFFGAWLGGKVFEAYGSYNWIWVADILGGCGGFDPPAHPRAARAGPAALPPSSSAAAKA